MPFISASHSNAASFSIFKQSMMQSDTLPLTDVIDDQRWQQVFDKHKIDFGSDEDAVYTPAVTLWALISQVFFSGEQRSCKVAVIRVAALAGYKGVRTFSRKEVYHQRHSFWQSQRDQQYGSAIVPRKHNAPPRKTKENRSRPLT